MFLCVSVRPTVPDSSSLDVLSVTTRRTSRRRCSGWEYTSQRGNMIINTPTIRNVKVLWVEGNRSQAERTEVCVLIHCIFFPAEMPHGSWRPTRIQSCLRFTGNVTLSAASATTGARTPPRAGMTLLSYHSQC